VSTERVALEAYCLQSSREPTQAPDSSTIRHNSARLILFTPARLAHSNGRPTPEISCERSNTSTFVSSSPCSRLVARA